ncbi:hypothetical protein FRC07_009836, partial [Ceratobasidium sp. 392]
SVSGGAWTNRDSCVGVVSLEDDVDEEVDSGVEIGVELEVGLSEVEQGAKSVRTGTDTTRCAGIVTAPGISVKAKDISVPEIVTGREIIVGSAMDKDWLADCETENVCSVLTENEVR